MIRMRTTNGLGLGLFGLALALSLASTLAADLSAASSTLIVNSADDFDDGACDAAHCSLREALGVANALPGPDTIAFDIPGTGPHTIRPRSPLPTISDPVTIDGYTQPGAHPNTNPPKRGTNAALVIELDGSLAGRVDALRIFAGRSTVRGLVINRFSDGIELNFNGGNVITGNFIGTDITGTVAVGNLDMGIRIFRSSANIIGGTSAAATNVISANSFFGIDIFSFGQETGNVIQGNLIGTDATGTVALSNGTGGILNNDVPGNVIGGRTARARNVISGNGFNGVTLVGPRSTDNHVFGNFIGSDASGTAPLGNAGFGVLIGEPEGPRRNIVGGQGHDKGNIIIAYNTLGGVRITRGDRNAVLTNAIFANGGLGIDLGDQGIEPNDTQDSDTGANQLQNYPVISAAISDPSGTKIKGTINSLPDTMFRLEFYSSVACDPLGNGEGETFLGHILVTTDNVGNAHFKVTSFGAVPVGHRITATATDAKGNTSEFSTCVHVGHQTQ